MSDKSRPSTWSLIAIPALISLVVTILRLVGELQGWNDQLFSNVAPGGEPKPGWVGISWLIPVFGFWFGFKLRRAYGEPDHLPAVFVRLIVALAIVIGGFFGLSALGLVFTPDADNPGEPRGLGYLLLLAVISLFVGMSAWWRLGRTLLLYGFAARIPVVIVTWLALENGWDTHYTKLPVGVPAAEGNELLFALCTPQLTIWPIFTVIAGGLFGALGAAVAGRR